MRTGEDPGAFPAAGQAARRGRHADQTRYILTTPTGTPIGPYRMICARPPAPLTQLPPAPSRQSEPLARCAGLTQRNLPRLHGRAPRRRYGVGLGRQAWSPGRTRTGVLRRVGWRQVVASCCGGQRWLRSSDRGAGQGAAGRMPVMTAGTKEQVPASTSRSNKPADAANWTSIAGSATTCSAHCAAWVNAASRCCPAVQHPATGHAQPWQVGGLARGARVLVLSGHTMIA